MPSEAAKSGAEPSAAPRESVEELVRGGLATAAAIADWYIAKAPRSCDQDMVRSAAGYGLFLAARDWNGVGSFLGFATIVIRRRIVDEIRHHAGRRGKHPVLVTGCRGDCWAGWSRPDSSVESADWIDAACDRLATPLQRRRLRMLAEPFTTMAEIMRDEGRWHSTAGPWKESVRTRLAGFVKRNT